MSTDEQSAGAALDPASDGRHVRLAAWLMATLLAMLPFTAVTFVPVTDLPQHLAQIRLLEELLGLAPATTDLGALHILYTAPSVLVYLPLLLAVKAFGPLVGGRVLLATLVGAELAAIHLVSARRGRPVTGTLLAGILVFNQALYWGFLNFICAVPLFLLFVDHVSRPPAAGRVVRDTMITLVLAGLTYLAHSVLFAAGALATVVFALVRRDRPRLAGARLLGLLPPVLAGLVWFPELAALRRAGGFDVSAYWANSPLERLSFAHLCDAFFGGLGGIVEPIFVVALALYVFASLVTWRRAFLREADPQLLAVAAALALVYLVAPDKWVNSMMLASRFAPLAAIVFVLAVPAPRAPERALGGYVLVVPLLFSLATTVAWSVFETEELTGLEASLRAVRGPTRIVGLDFRRGTWELKTLPFFQLFAYVQAEHGGEVNFSFAEHMSSIVAYRAPRPVRWSPALEWSPHRVTAADLTHFDHALIVGDERVQTDFARFARATPLVREGWIRMYRLPTRAPWRN